MSSSVEAFRPETVIPAGSNYLCRKCGCYGGKFCVDWSLHKYEEPQRGT